ncbi:MAG: STAS domain-containing protein [Rhodospirillaceae bacterium]|nr:STAS domain-containing protein [Rhodospirillaceae bacterium]
MHYAISADPSGSVIHFSDRFTHADRAAFHQALSELSGLNEQAELVIDLAEVPFIDSSALGMLLLLRGDERLAGCKVILRGAQGQVLKLIELTRFSEMFTIEP